MQCTLADLQALPSAMVLPEHAGKQSWMHCPLSKQGRAVALLEGRGPSTLGPSCQLVSGTSSLCQCCTALHVDLLCIHCRCLGCMQPAACVLGSLPKRLYMQLRAALSLSRAAARSDPVLPYIQAVKMTRVL